ncbi:hypothetical protein [Maritimibacter sp. DP1N21-5]|uniref:hypothetical protein n=1 Tax=Maritimibacter sp. DP1N21-5 TaxID=2836867 RepID=UPI001C46F1F9|nr:hypothetical protein [Maritimibacter sp. DP1N21-5]MBV7410327.1 hypothetical protein [Maritimibacter sp. DP1N21-5]
MTRKPYKRAKRGAGRHVQLPEYLQATEAWATMKPGPRALYIELKRRFTGSNNGRIVLSHPDAARLLNSGKNTMTRWFRELEERGFIAMEQAPYLGPSGVGVAALWSLQEMPTVDGKAARKGFVSWKQAHHGLRPRDPVSKGSAEKDSH